MGPGARQITVALAFALFGACATSSPPSARHAEGASEPHRVKLAVLPLESDLYPRLAKTLNELLRDARVSGVDDYFVSKVTLEVVQLSIECVDPTSACYSAVGKSLASDRLLMATLGPSGKRRDHSVRVEITLFDVVAGQAVHSAERVFKSEREAVNGARALVESAVAAPSRSAAAERR
jgi:hypothetical protein